MYKDIAESKRAQEQIESLARFSAENPSPVLRIGRDGMLLYANDASESLLKEWNCRVGQVVGQDWREWVAQAFESGSEKRVEAEHAGRTLAFAIAPVAEAGYANLYGRDITERKKAEDALLNSQRDLSVKNRIANIFLTIPDDRMYSEILSLVLEMLESEFGVFGYLDEKGDFVVPTMTRHIWDKCQVADKTYVFERSMWGESTWPEAIRQKRTIYSNEPSANVPEGHISIQRHISMPILFRDEVIGLFQVANKAADYGDADIALLQSVADNVAPILYARLEGDRQEQKRREAEGKREVLLHDMGERNKELACMYSVSKSIRDRKTTAEILQDVADSISGGWHYPEITRGKVRFGSDEFVSEPFEETEWKQTSDIVVNGKCCGTIEVYYLEERPELDEGPFMAEERNLINGMARAVSEGLDRKEAEQERERLLKTVAAKNQELQDIIYIASHDLKSPLVNILGFSGELLKDLEHLESLLGKDKQEESEKNAIDNLLHNAIPQEVKFISSAGRMLKGLINGMLKVSRIGSAEYTIEPMNMNELIREVVDGLEFSIRDGGVSVTVEELPDCLGDASKTGQLFGNLVNNALKYLDPERRGIIRIRGRCEEGRSEYCVEDNGIGIDAGHQAEVFEIFHRLNPSDDVGGEGLGLTIAMRILDQMDGSMRLESEPGKGSKFFVSLPGA